MEFSDLRVFREVAMAGNISKAANLLGFVQSGITARIQRLEAELQTPLFYRQPRGVVLTASGKTLLLYTEKILRLLDETQKAVRYSPEPRGNLSIGSMETTAAVRLPAILKQYHVSYPDVSLSLLTDATERLFRSVLDYQIDGALVAAPIEHPDIMQVNAFNEEMVFVTDTQCQSISALTDIQQRTLLVFRSGCSYRARLEQILHSHGIVPDKIFEFGALEAIIAGVAAGIGVSLLPYSVVHKHVAERILNYHPVPGPYGCSKTIFIWRKDALMTSALKQFIELIQAAAKAEC